MRNVSDYFRHVCHLASMLLMLIADAVRYLGLCIRPSPILGALHHDYMLQEKTA